MYLISGRLGRRGAARPTSGVRAGCCPATRNGMDCATRPGGVATWRRCRRTGTGRLAVC